MRRLAAPVLLLAALAVTPLGLAGVCPSAPSAHSCCCAPRECACPGPSADLVGPRCSCASTPVPAAPRPAGPATGGPDSELAAMAAPEPSCLLSPAPYPPARAAHPVAAAAGISLFLLDCALLI